MTPYILGEAANQITPDTAPIYDLYATVNHYGNVYLGHHTASIKSPVGDSTGVFVFVFSSVSSSNSMVVFHLI